jgi:hypothetical protein
VTPTYRVRSWAEHFENHETRKLRSLRYILVPNKQDGKGYRRVAAHPRKCELFAAWVLLLQVASKCPERGTLADEDGPLDADDLAAMTGFPAEAFALAFEVLTDPRIGWLTTEPDGGPREVPGDCGTERENHPDERNGTERNGLEGKGNESRSNGTCSDAGKASNGRAWSELSKASQLRDPAFVSRLYAEAAADGRLTDSDAMRVTFEATAEYIAGRSAVRNVAAYFTTLLRSRFWERPGGLPAAAEDKAAARRRTRAAPPTPDPHLAAQASLDEQLRRIAERFGSLSRAGP